MIQELLRETKTPVRKIAARMSAGSPLVDSRKSPTESPLRSTIPEMPSVMKIVSEKEIPRLMGHVVHRNPSSQYVVPREAWGQGPEYVLKAPDDEKVIAEDQNKYITSEAAPLRVGREQHVLHFAAIEQRDDSCEDL